MAARGRVSFDLEVGAAEAGVRLDRLLRRLLPGMPLSAVHRMIRKGEVKRLSAAAQAGGRGRGRLSASDRLEPGQTVTLLLPPQDARALRKRLSARPRTPGAIEIPFLYRDEHLIAFDKPAGVASHPGSGHALGRTVLGALYAARGRSATFRPALVGRLDRDTSGVQLAGVSPEGLRGLSALVRSGGIRKTYLALVRLSAAAQAGGEGIPDEGRIDSPLVDTKGGRARMRAVAPGTEGALDALTDYRILAQGGGAALVEVRPLTGRRHQIRAHFASRDAPLAGDVRYGDRSWNRKLAARTGLERLFLHCARVAFRHPAVMSVALEGPPPLRAAPPICESAEPVSGAARDERSDIERRALVRSPTMRRAHGREVSLRSPLPEELARALEALGISPGPFVGRRRR